MPSTYNREQPSLESLLGVYQYINASTNSRKFWAIHYDEGHGTYTTAWGRIGTVGQTKQGLSGSEALTKIQEKISKGYTLSNDGKPKRKLKIKTPKPEEGHLTFIEELKKICGE